MAKVSTDIASDIDYSPEASTEFEDLYAAAGATFSLETRALLLQGEPESVKLSVDGSVWPQVTTKFVFWMDTSSACAKLHVRARADIDGAGVFTAQVPVTPDERSALGDPSNRSAFSVLDAKFRDHLMFYHQGSLQDVRAEGDSEQAS